MKQLSTGVRPATNIITFRIHENNSLYHSNQRHYGDEENYHILQHEKNYPYHFKDIQ